jgi:hypothetical protein
LAVVARPTETTPVGLECSCQRIQLTFTDCFSPEGLDHPKDERKQGSLEPFETWGAPCNSDTWRVGRASEARTGSLRTPREDPCETVPGEKAGEESLTGPFASWWAKLHRGSIWTHPAGPGYSWSLYERHGARNNGRLTCSLCTASAAVPTTYEQRNAGGNGGLREEAPLHQMEWNVGTEPHRIVL